MKDFLSRLWHILSHPHWGLVLSVIFLDAIAITSGILNAVFLDDETLAIASYSLIGVTSSYLAFLLVRLLIGLYKKRLLPALESSRLASYFPEGKAFRILFFAGLSSLVNLAFAGMNLFLAAAYLSPWYGSLAAYYSLLMILRVSTVLSSFLAARRHEGDSISFRLAQEKIRLVEAALLLPFDLLMGGAVAMMVVEGPPALRGNVYAIASACYAFYKFSVALAHLLRAKKEGHPILSTLRLVSFADALMSMVSLTVLMIATFGEEGSLLPLKAMVGFAAVMVTAGLSIAAILRSSKALLNG